MTKARQVLVCKDEHAIFTQAAEMFAQLAAEAIALYGRFTVALSGGSTPKSMYQLLAKDYQDRIEWSKVHLFWGDERSVPPTDDQSNYRMANEAMISKLPIPTGQVYRMTAEAVDMEAEALNYEAIVRRVFQLSEGEMPAFDLFLLGMGDDGHTASLFPGTQALTETKRMVVVNWVEKFHTNRMTFTTSAINNSRNVLFMTAGAKKQAPLKEVLAGEYNPQLYPSQLIKPTEGNLIWLVDEGAAGGTVY